MHLTNLHHKLHRKSSPINWFPRKKVDSCLKRKIKMLQDNICHEFNSGEKKLQQGKQHIAIEARKTALVEAPYFLRPGSRAKKQKTLVLKAEKNATEAFEAATAMDCPRKPSQIETSTINEEDLPLIL
ncbi:uncharacterized protein LOC110626278 [Manihot esculenta]|uniref:uncharacterized protein LOC110626278 n=1 Tax=Manihot esculenta TaxID=3983 RepID=UPI000B5D1129|nr:uncharacterized protein LOC110626278 [Manihot esculenta]XP_021627787.1 uncharacterized protein LOC110626278 [Manihot esculenta]XP_043817487.1 uncharacterized protein LOC110626278 [Manihot esculenta]XP_043817488.1 uncharacterized protein LOC110626278 [Manihot esculenta]XP_043817489.1 uncharacterized protein LOC110626278 [Manihot esculenta]